MRSAPPASAADASAALATLTSSRIARYCIIHEMTDAVAAPLAGRAVLVTGASSGIGRAIALAAARAGADVALTYRANEAGARDVEREIRALGRRAAVIRLDLADDASVRALGPAARDALGRLDVWVNNAGADILTGAGAALSDVEKLDLLLARRSARHDARVVAGGGDAGRAGGGRRHHQHELGSRAHRHGRAPTRSCSPR